MNVLHGAFGLAGLLFIAWLLSENRWRIPLRVVLAGVALQIALACLFIKFPPATGVFLLLNDGVNALQKATDAGTALVFGYLGSGTPPFVEAHPEASFILAFRAFPLVLVISAIASLLLYWGILQRVVAVLAFALRRTLGVGGALALGGAVHIFVGMVEAPLLVRPYLNRMSRGELFALMSCGMAGIAGTMMVVYAAILGSVIPDALPHILIASVISTPAALAVSALMVPFVPDPDETGELSVADPPASAMEAIVRGTIDGIGIVATIIAMLIVLVALVSLVNLALGLLPHAGEPITLQQIFAYIFWPLLWLVGIPASGTLDGLSPDGHEDRAQRIRRLSQSLTSAARGVEPALAPDDDIRSLRLCQFRQSRNFGRRHDGDGTGAQARHHFSRAAFYSVGDAGDVDERHGRGNDQLAF